jgi:ribosomal protein L7/L12
MIAKVKLAKIISIVTHLAERQLDDDEIERFDSILALETPYRADPGSVNEVLSAMYGGRKIEAIKAYRNLTGASLVDSKNAIEGYWPSQAT